MFRNFNFIKKHSVLLPNSKNVHHPFCQLHISLERVRTWWVTWEIQFCPKNQSDITFIHKSKFLQVQLF